MYVIDKEDENAFAHQHFSLGSAKRLLDGSDKLRMSLSTDMAAWFLGESLSLFIFGGAGSWLLCTGFL